MYIYAVKFSSSIRPAVFLAGGWADTKFSEQKRCKSQVYVHQVTVEFSSTQGRPINKKTKVCPVSTDNINENKFDRHRILS